ncbi:hypothetical protein C8R42DRAFT_641196 [Lentinula raphanica]|nr:hypothetical protein C8R42DRAFT_641196 [Lentinula raphanica]
MAKRSRSRLRAVYASRILRPTSPADGPGFIYAFLDDGCRWKIGMTRDFTRRQAEWNRSCPCGARVWMPPIAVTRRRRMGLDFIVPIGSHRNFHFSYERVGRLEGDHSSGAKYGCGSVSYKDMGTRTIRFIRLQGIIFKSRSLKKAMQRRSLIAGITGTKAWR